MTRITVAVEGGLLPDDLLERIAGGFAPGQRAADFGVASGRLSDEIMKAFSDAQSYWTAFKHRYERASVRQRSGQAPGAANRSPPSPRETFMVPMLEALGYGAPGHSLQFRRTASAGDQSFVISHAAGEEANAPPINIVSADDKLDERGTSRRSAHSSVQEYLNLRVHRWPSS
ncbi:MAG: hypothetical protein JO166_15805 [Deltaproteobacteria bacterium]|nr:hypothetical protein [Deltaproteobacteria bacterium]